MFFDVMVEVSDGRSCSCMSYRITWVVDGEILRARTDNGGRKCTLYLFPPSCHIFE